MISFAFILLHSITIFGLCKLPTTDLGLIIAEGAPLGAWLFEDSSICRLVRRALDVDSYVLLLGIAEDEPSCNPTGF